VHPTFISFRDYVRFVGAKEFVQLPDERPFLYSKNALEKVGHVCVMPFLTPVDEALQNIQNPLVMTALTVAALAVVTIIFYPLEFVAGLRKIAPFLFKISAEKIKMTTFISSQVCIAGLGLRALGRLFNPNLMSAWTRREVIPIAIGMQVLREW
jgi:hypothetical protein